MLIVQERGSAGNDAVAFVQTGYDFNVRFVGQTELYVDLFFEVGGVVQHVHVVLAVVLVARAERDNEHVFTGILHVCVSDQRTGGDLSGFVAAVIGVRREFAVIFCRIDITDAGVFNDLIGAHDHAFEFDGIRVGLGRIERQRQYSSHAELLRRSGGIVHGLDGFVEHQEHVFVVGGVNGDDGLARYDLLVGVGGIHSIHTPKIFHPKDDEHIGHADVTSMYPSFLIKYQWGPRHLGKLFCDIFSEIYDERVEAKRTGQKIKNLFLKIVLNSPTGKMQQEVSWMYDPFNVFKIRINGQLILLMLVDRLLSVGCEIIQCNTDGVVYRAKKAARAEIDNLIHEVESLTRLTFETDEYEAFYQYAINDYFGVMKGYSETHNPKLIEEKGMFITKNKLGKGLAPVVIPKAVINYFLTKQPVSEFIEKDRDIRDFLMTQAVDRKFKVVHGDKPVQRINRFYASTNGPYLYKVKKNENPGHKIGQWGEEYDVPEESWFNMLTKSGVTILNKFDDLPIEDRKINYRYYISEAKKIVADFTEQQLELF